MHRVFGLFLEMASELIVLVTWMMLTEQWGIP